MNKVVEFLNTNPVQYLAPSAVTERQSAVHSCSRARWTASCGSAPITPRMSTTAFRRPDLIKSGWYTQGDYGLFRCSEPCCQETFDNEAVIREMLERKKKMKFPRSLFPSVRNTENR